MMKAWTVKKPGSLENLQLVDLADPGAPAAGEIRVALHATSLNYHDFAGRNGGNSHRRSADPDGGWRRRGGSGWRRSERISAG